MSEIKYNGDVVNSVASEIDKIGNQVGLLSTDMQKATTKIVSANGFSEYIGGVTSDSFSSAVDECETAVSEFVSAIRNQQILILGYSGDENAIKQFLASLNRKDFDKLDFGPLEDYITVDLKAGKVLSSAGATLLTLGAGVVEGVLDFVETGADLIFIAGTGVASIFTGLYDWITGSHVTEDMWEDTKAFVSDKKVESIFDSFYANTTVGRYMKDNAYGFDTVRGIGKGVGYTVGVVAVTALTFGAGGAAISAGQFATTAGLMGFSNGTEEAWADGASTLGGLAYGAASGAWEGAQWYAGAKINAFGGKTVKGALKRVALDTADSALEGFVQPGLTMIYKDYGGSNFGENYAKAFESAGGWGNVRTQAAIGAVASTAGEASGLRKLLKDRNNSSVDIDASALGEGGAALLGAGGADRILKSSDAAVRALPEHIDDSTRSIVKNVDNSPKTFMDNVDISTKKIITENVDTPIKSVTKNADYTSRTIARSTGGNANYSTGSITSSVGKNVDYTPRTVASGAVGNANYSTGSITSSVGKNVDYTPRTVASSAGRNVNYSTGTITSSVGKNVDYTPRMVTENVGLNKASMVQQRVGVSSVESALNNTKIYNVVDNSSSPMASLSVAKTLDSGSYSGISSSSTRIGNSVSNLAPEVGTTIKATTALSGTGLAGITGISDAKLILGDTSLKTSMGGADITNIGKTLDVSNSTKTNIHYGDSYKNLVSNNESVVKSMDNPSKTSTASLVAEKTRTSKQLDSDLRSLETKYDKLLSERENAVANYGEKSPQVARLDKQIDQQFEKIKTKGKEKVAAQQAEYKNDLENLTPEQVQKKYVGVESKKTGAKLIQGDASINNPSVIEGNITTHKVSSGNEVRPNWTDASAKVEGQIDGSALKKLPKDDVSLKSLDSDSGKIAVESGNKTILSGSDTSVQKIRDTKVDATDSSFKLTSDDTIDSVAEKLDNAVERGSITREQADTMFEKAGDEFHLAEKEKIVELKKQNEQYELNKQANIEKKQQLVEFDKAKTENIKGYDEAVRQIDEEIAKNNMEIDSLQKKISESSSSGSHAVNGFESSKVDISDMKSVVDVDGIKKSVDTSGEYRLKGEELVDAKNYFDRKEFNEKYGIKDTEYKVTGSKVNADSVANIDNVEKSIGTDGEYRLKGEELVDAKNYFDRKEFNEKYGIKDTEYKVTGSKVNADSVANIDNVEKSIGTDGEYRLKGENLDTGKTVTSMSEAEIIASQKKVGEYDSNVAKAAIDSDSRILDANSLDDTSKTIANSAVEESKLATISNEKTATTPVAKTNFTEESDILSLKEMQTELDDLKIKIEDLAYEGADSSSSHTLKELNDIYSELSAKEQKASIALKEKLKLESPINPELEQKVLNGAPEYILGKDRAPLPQKVIEDRVKAMGIHSELRERSLFKGSQVESLANQFNVPYSEMEKIIDAKLASFVNESQFGCRLYTDSLESCLDSGYIKNQFETGSSHAAIGMGEYKSNQRALFEERMFGIPQDTPFSDRPVYGMAFPGGDDDFARYMHHGPGKGYGDCVIVFNKDAVADSTSFVLGDSLSSSKYMAPSTVNNPKFEGAFRQFGDNANSLEEFKNANFFDAFNGDDANILELQYHGQKSHVMNNTNIKEVIFETEPSKVIQDKLKSKEIPWRVLNDSEASTSMLDVSNGMTKNMDTSSKAIASESVAESAQKKLQVMQTYPEQKVIESGVDTTSSSLSRKTVGINGESGVDSLSKLEKLETRTKPDTKVETRIKPDTEVETRIKPDAEVETRLKPDAEVETRLRPDTEVETRIRPDAEAETRIRPDAEAETRIKPDTEVETRIKPDTEVETRIKSDAELDSLGVKNKKIYRDVESFHKQEFDELDTKFKKRKANLEAERDTSILEIDSSVKEKIRSLTEKSKNSSGLVKLWSSKRLKSLENDIRLKKAQIEANYNAKLSKLQDSIALEKTDISYKIMDQYEARYRTEHALTSSNASMKEIRVAKSYVFDEVCAMKPGDTVGFSGRTKVELLDLERRLDDRGMEVMKLTRDRLYKESKIDPIVKSRVLEGKSPSYSLGEGRGALSQETIVERVRDMGLHDSAELNECNKQLRSLAQKYGVHESEMQHVLDKKLKEALETGNFGKRTKMSTLEKCLDSGYIKSQFETGTSSGWIDRGENKCLTRANAEEGLFGLSQDTPYVDRPVYGMVFPSDDATLKDYIETGPGFWYGSSNKDKCVIMFNKDAISDTTSISVGDSLAFRYDGVLSSTVLDPKFSGGFPGFASKYNSIEELKGASIADLFSGDDQTYLELQLHGQSSHAMTAENIKEVVFEKNPSQILQDKLKLRGIPWRVL